MFNEQIIKKAMDEVHKEVEKAIKEDNQPFGAVMVDHQGDIISQTHNEVNSSSDPTAHAEINLIRQTALKIKTRDFSHLSIFVNSEPCPMCAAALARAKIKAIYFGPSQEVGTNPNIRAEDIFNKAQSHIEIYKGINEDIFKEQIMRGRKVNEGKQRGFK